MGDYHQYEPPSLAPLQITPAMMAQARAAQAAAPGSAAAPPPPPPMRTFQPTASPNAGEDLNTLAAMFPDYDRDVISSVLAMSGGLDDAIQQLLEMGGGAPEDGIPGTQHQSDEELALALFKQFAEDLEQQLGRPIPADVRNDPVRYEAFVREHFERELARDGSQLSSRAMQVSPNTQYCLSKLAVSRTTLTPRDARILPWTEGYPSQALRWACRVQGRQCAADISRQAQTEPRVPWRIRNPEAPRRAMQGGSFVT
eukprot:scaffold16054_cov127-Isochrysis_galbana.AAC.7